MLAAARGMETWARTVRIPVYTTTPPPDGWQEVCRAELERPQVWYLTITSGEPDGFVLVVVRVRAGNGLTTWLEERGVYAYQPRSRMLELWIPARSIEVDVIARGEHEQADLAITGSLAPIELPRFGAEW
jgi:hypothetical protein